MKQVAKAIIHQKGEFLLQLRDDHPEIAYPNTWSFFGGELEEGETHWGALKRELQEEIGWQPVTGKYLWTWQEYTDNCSISLYEIEFCGVREALKLTEGQKLCWFLPSEFTIIKIANPSFVQLQRYFQTTSYADLFK